MRDFVEQLNAESSEERLAALKELYEGGFRRGDGEAYFVNNHIHTTYSFSPYSPTKAVYMAAKAGLKTAGIMDHDSIGGAEEFVRAAAVLGLPVTVGVETRVNFAETPFGKRRINNPDQPGVAYMALHGIPHQNFALVDEFFAPVRNKRNKRNRAMSQKLAAVLDNLGLSFDFDADVLPHALVGQGGSVTERTICYAAACKLTNRFGRGAALVKVLTEQLGLPVTGSIAERLCDTDNIHYEYDLTGVLKSGLVKAFYIDADEELPTLDEFIALRDRVGAIGAYAYLGDVGQSVTGDKKAQTFEDEYLPELIAFVKEKGLNAVAYMPSRNSVEQLKNMRALCRQYELFEISGEDINSSRQSFICPQLKGPEFQHLIPATWALLGHERAASRDVLAGMFAPAAVAAYPSLDSRIAHFATLAQV